MPDPIKTPPLPGLVTVGDGLEAVFDALGRDLAAAARECVDAYGDFHLALSGGSTPLPFYERLAAEPRFRGIPWSRTHLWTVDERRVPFDDERSNWRAIAKALASAPVPAEQRHPIPADAADAAERYEAELRSALGRRPRGEDRLDFVVLGMGADGHTASLFPRTAVLGESERLVGECEGPGAGAPPRVTMTYPLLNSARRVAILVTGTAKAATLARVAAGSGDARELPVKGIAPRPGELRWYLDRAACGS